MRDVSKVHEQFLSYLCNNREFVSSYKYIINQKNHDKMSFIRVLLAILFPPLAVLGKGCGSFLIVLLLTFCGWVPGVIAALVILNNPN